ncbi:transposase [Streptomyces sp. NBC_00289]|uniref:IS66 family transposase n=1 Tax=Streptomyces sp. NBC_00289 TaxID=2975703 RepID=UPI00352CE437
MASLLSEAVGLVEDSLNLIRALLVMGHILHADETTTWIGAVRRWLHVACTGFLTLLHLAPRSRDGAGQGGVLPHYRGVLVHDSLSIYGGWLASRASFRAGGQAVPWRFLAVGDVRTVAGSG